MIATAAATVLFQPELSVFKAQVSALQYGNCPLYLFINGPLGEEAETCVGSLQDTVLLRSRTNVGVGVALNALAERAASDGITHLLLLDQDSVPQPGLLAALSARFVQINGPDCPLAVLAPMLRPPAGENYLPVRYAWRDQAAGTAHFAPTSGSLLSLRAWKEVGPFRADYFVGGIDVEWGFRAWSRGYASVIAQDLSLQHRWGTPAQNPRTPQILRHSDERTFYYVRNGVDLLRLPHVPWGWRLRYAANLAAQAACLIHHRGYDRRTRDLLWSAVRDGWRGRLGPRPESSAAAPSP